MSKRIGYVRVSTAEQNLDLQLNALRGCVSVFRDEGISGTARERAGLTDALNALREGDVLVVWKLDRLGRSLAHLIDIVSTLKKRGVGFVSVSESIDTTHPAGKLFFHLMGAMAEFERDLIIERTNAGLQAARQRGQRLGRPRSLGWEQVAAARDMLAEGRSMRQTARLFKVSHVTLSRRLREPA